VGVRPLYVTVNKNIFVVVLNESTALPVAVEVLEGTSLTPFKVALKIAVNGTGTGIGAGTGLGTRTGSETRTGAGVSTLSHETKPDKIVKIAKNRIERFIIKYLKG
jgi:glucokinase